MADRLRSALGDALEAIERECPAAYAALAAALDGHLVSLCVDGERLLLGSGGGRVRLHGAGDATLHVATSWREIERILDGDAVLLDALLDERVLVLGGPDALLRGYDAFVSFVQGAVRSPSVQSIRERTRAA